MVYITPYHATIIYALEADTDVQHILMCEPKQFQETRHAPAAGWCTPGLINNKAAQLLFSWVHTDAWAHDHCT